MKFRYRLFNQSSKVDEAIAQKNLDLKGFHRTSLQRPILFRGDMRSPGDIFSKGFKRKEVNQGFLIPDIDENRCSSACIATTTDLTYAVGFADNPMNTVIFDSADSNDGWVYVFYAKEGIELYKDELFQDITSRNVAKKINEVVLTSVPPEHVIAGFCINTTQNEISDYYNQDIRSNSKQVQWQIEIKQYCINKNCTISDSHPELYQVVLLEFLEHCNRGYYRIPWAPCPEDPFFNLTSDQRQAGQRFHLTRDEAKKIKYPEQLQLLESGYDKTVVLDAPLTRQHFRALLHGVSVDDVLQAQLIDLNLLWHAIGVKQEGDQINFQDIIGLTSVYQAYGIGVGFSREDVESDWFTQTHVCAVLYDKISMEFVRNQQESIIEKLIELKLRKEDCSAEDYQEVVNGASMLRLN
jgi:hypothetical protein